MNTPLLQTKFYIPPVRSNLVPRTSLVSKLEAGLRSGKRLSLIAGPAGFGKTTLVTNWIQSIVRPVAWLSLDAGDDELQHFLTYLLGAIRTVESDFGVALASVLASAQKADSSLLVQALLNALVRHSQPLMLVLDDYHVIHRPEIHAALSTLVDYLPPQVHLVMTSREEPPLPLPRWRARNQLTHIDAAELRFGYDEAAAFLRSTMGLTLEDAAVAVLEARTEGWVAGLQLAALSLQNSGDTQSRIEALVGSDRHIADYLVTEVLAGRSEEIQRFLIQTSILDRFNAALCDAVLERKESQAILEQLEQNALFVVPLDNRRNWYRYHHLFADLLRHRLVRELPDAEIERLHRRAAGWFVARDVKDEAISHYLAAGDFDAAAGLVASISPGIIFEEGGAGQIKRWAAALPAETLADFPQIAVTAAGAHLMTGDFDHFFRYHSLTADDPRIAGERMVLEAIAARHRGGSEEALQLAQLALTLLPADAEALRSVAAMQVAVNEVLLGRLREAIRAIDAAIAALPKPLASRAGLYLQAVNFRGGLAHQAADLYAAERYFRQGLELLENEFGHQGHPMAGLMLTGLGFLHYQWNELDKATGYFDRALELGEASGIMDVLVEALEGQIRLALARGASDEALAYLQRLTLFGPNSEFPRLVAEGQAFTAQFRLRAGDLQSAIRWANAGGMRPEDRPTWPEFFHYRALLDVRLAESQALGTQTLLPAFLDLNRYLFAHTDAQGFTLSAIKLLIQQALLLDRLDDRPAALQALGQALQRSRAGTLVRVYVDRGKAVQALLREVDFEDPHYVAQLLAGFDKEQTTAAPAASAPTTEYDLTPRELEVLQAIVAGLSNREIEEQLVISRNTVRTHIKNLYSKLDVSSRAQAIRRAHDLGLT